MRVTVRNIAWMHLLINIDFNITSQILDRNTFIVLENWKVYALGMCHWTSFRSVNCQCMVLHCSHMFSVFLFGLYCAKVSNDLCGYQSDKDFDKEVLFPGLVHVHPWYECSIKCKNEMPWTHTDLGLLTLKSWVIISGKE